MSLTVISLLALVTAILCIRGKYSNKEWLVYVFKPLTTILILVIAIIASSDISLSFKNIIFIALVFSLLGDIFLMLHNKFLFGLVSFLIAHLLFLWAFVSLCNSTHLWLMGIFLLIGIVLYSILYPYLGKMKIPVLIYVTVISAMAWRAWEYYLAAPGTTSLLMGIGVLLFMFSDANIAFNKFRKKYDSAEALILSTYYLSIWLISISLFFYNK